MKVYHVTYEPSYKSTDIHFWAKCNLGCHACYTYYENLDFGLFDDPIARIASKPLANPPSSFLSLPEVLGLLRGRDIDRAIFMGTEPALDPEMPALAEALHHEFHCYNILLTNGLKLPRLEHIDEFIFSIKACSEKLHLDYTGQSNEKILANFATLYKSGERLQAETVLIPGLIEAAEIERIARFVASVDRSIPLRIDAYFPVGENPWRAATVEEVEEAARLAGQHLDRVGCLTLDLKRTGEPSVRLY